MFKQRFIAASLTVAVVLGAVGFLWWDSRQSQVEVSASYEPSRMHQGSLRPQPAGDALPDETEHRLLPGGLYRCDGVGGTRYQDEPCPGDTRQSQVSRGTLSVVAPPPAVAARQAPVYSAQTSSSSVSKNSTAQRDRIRCDQHRKAILRIDSEGRVGGSGQKMDRLREQRRHHVEQMWRLKCESLL